MKKIVSLLVAAIMIISLVPTVMAYETAKVTFDGAELDFDVPPMIINGRTMVPVRKIVEAMGADVAYDEKTETVTTELNGKVVRLVINSKEIEIDGIKKELDVPAMEIDGRTLIPTRALAEAYGCKVDWDGITSTVIIKSPDEKEGVSGDKPKDNYGVTIPTYTDIVGEPLKLTKYKNAGISYCYNYTGTDAYAKYVAHLTAEGWTIAGESFYKNDDLLTIEFDLRNNYIIVTVENKSYAHNKPSNIQQEEYSLEVSPDYDLSYDGESFKTAYYGVNNQVFDFQSRKIALNVTKVASGVEAKKIIKEHNPKITDEMIDDWTRVAFIDVVYVADPAKAGRIEIKEMLKRNNVAMFENDDVKISNLNKVGFLDETPVGIKKAYVAEGKTETVLMDFNLGEYTTMPCIKIVKNPRKTEEVKYLYLNEKPLKLDYYSEDECYEKTGIPRYENIVFSKCLYEKKISGVEKEYQYSYKTGSITQYFEALNKAGYSLISEKTKSNKTNYVFAKMSGVKGEIYITVNSDRNIITIQVPTVKV